MHSPCGLHAFAEPRESCPICERTLEVTRSSPRAVAVVRTGKPGRPAKLHELNGERRTLRQWLAEPWAARGLTPVHVAARLAVGMPLERALTEPATPRSGRRCIGCGCPIGERRVLCSSWPRCGPDAKKDSAPSIPA